MKKLNKFSALCAFILALCMLVCVISVSAADNYVVLYGFAFDFNNDGEAVIHHYDDRSADVRIPASLLGADVTEIADYAFFGDTAITSLSFADAAALKRIGVNAFHGCTQLSSLSIPDSVQELAFGAFQNCTGVTSLSIGEGIELIPSQCFYGCTALTAVDIPASVTEIGTLAFSGCASLTCAVIPGGVERIAADAFDGCDDLVIYCEKESAAMQYALDNGFDTIITDPDEYLLGDADGDGAVTILDATKIQRLLAALTDDPGRLIALRGDCNGDGLNIMDATKIQRFLAGFSTDEPVGEIVSNPKKQ